MTVASEIRAEMARQRMSVRDLSESSGVSPSTITRKVQNEERRLLVDEINAIGEALGLPGWELMRRAQAEKVSA